MSGASKPKGSSVRADFFNHREALRTALAPGSSNVLKRARSPGVSERSPAPLPRAPVVEPVSPSVWPKYQSFLVPEVRDFYKDKDLSAIMDDSGAHALKVSPCASFYALFLSCCVDN